jgi:hypothetical protein
MMMRSAWLSLGFVALAAASCGYPRLPELPGSDGASSDGEPPPSFSLELLAGDIGSPGNVDGTGADAHFLLPYGVAVDSVGNVYVADTFNYTIRKVAP